MSFKEQLLKGSYRGVSFNFVQAGKTGGRKTVNHNFLNSDIVVSEDLGKAPETLSLLIRISGEGGDYLANKSKMETALKTKGPAILRHPTYGKLNVALNGDYSINENLSSLGFAELSVSFIVVEHRRSFIQFASIAPQNLNNLANKFAKQKELSFSNLYGISNITSLKQAGAFVSAVSKDFKQVQNLIDNPFKAGDFAGQLLGFEKGAFEDVSDLARDTYLLFYNANNTIESASDRYDFFSSLFGFGDDADEINQTTRARVELAKNQEVQRTTIQANAIMFASASATLVNYDTDSQLENVISQIDAQFKKVQDDDGTTSEDYALLQEQRVLFAKATNELILDTSRIIEVDVNNIGLSSLIYQYYGTRESSDDFDRIYNLILSLNEFEETGNLNGTIKLVTESGV